MFLKKIKKPQNRIDTLIGAGSKIAGDVSFTGGLRVDGEICGNVRAEGEHPGILVVSEHARIEGDLQVGHLVVNGVVNGSICSSEMVELQAQARVTGDVQYNTIEIHLGAVIEGRLLHQGSLGKSAELKLAASN